LSDEVIRELKTGDKVMISGIIYSARDAAHKRLADFIEKGESLPIDLAGQVIYYVGPAPAKAGFASGAAGPTSSYRMDPYAPDLIAKGLKGMIGKGPRSGRVLEAMKKFKAVYLAATGGAGALISKTIKRMEVVAFEDLGPEAMRRMEVEGFPAIVVNDIYGNDLYVEGRKRYRQIVSSNNSQR